MLGGGGIGIRSLKYGANHAKRDADACTDYTENYVSMATSLKISPGDFDAIIVRTRQSAQTYSYQRY
jgi:hypothetical protein